MSRILDALDKLSDASKARIFDALILDKDVRDEERDHIVLRTVYCRRSRHDSHCMAAGIIPPFYIDGKKVT